MEMADREMHTYEACERRGAQIMFSKNKPRGPDPHSPKTRGPLSKYKPESQPKKEEKNK